MECCSTRARLGERVSAPSNSQMAGHGGWGGGVDPDRAGNLIRQPMVLLRSVVLGAVDENGRNRVPEIHAGNVVHRVVNPGPDA